MSFEIAGRLHKIFPTEQKTDSFKAREFVIETDGQYPQYVKFQLVQDKCEAMDSMQEGESIKVYFDLRGREWQGKYFTNLQAWKLEYGQSSEAPTSPAGDGNFIPPPPTQKDQPTNQEGNDAFDDLPF